MGSNIGLKVVDLGAKEFRLSFYDEPDIPQALPATETWRQYNMETTQKWSQMVAQAVAFIFVSPQYNWSLPAVGKNAVDLLYHEWAKKPVILVTYGGHGGLKAQDAWKQTFLGVKLDLLYPCTALNISVSQNVPEQISTEQYHNWNTDGSISRFTAAFANLVGVLNKQHS